MRCEIDAHGLCAEDHLPYQGRQYSLRAYERLNSSLQRPIGTCNCRHGISYIILGVSPKTYDDSELQKMKDYSNAKIKIRDKECTRYQATQLMRQSETNMMIPPNMTILGPKRSTRIPDNGYMIA